MNSIIKQDTQRLLQFLLDYKWHAVMIRFLVGILMISIYCWIIGGFINLMLHLYSYGLKDWAHGAELMIKDIVIMLVALELIRTLQSYLILGRVRVTFILDAALVVLIGELISLWYGEYTASEIVINVAVIAALSFLRILTTKYSPEIQDEP